MKILCITQYDDGAINGVSKEAISLGQELSEKTNGKLSIATFNEGAANQLQKYSSDQIILAKDDNLKDYNPLYYTAAANQIIEKDNDIANHHINFKRLS